MKTVILEYDFAITDLSIPPVKRDALLEGDNSGIRYLIDFANEFCYDPATPPTQGKTLRDLSEISGVAAINTAGTFAFAANKLDFTGTSGRACVSMPASVLADLYADQNYILCAYYQLPLIENFPPVGGGQNTTLITAESGTADHYGNSAEIVMAAWDMGAVGRLKFTRPIAVATAGAELINLDMTPHAGRVTQIAVWRTDAGWNARLKSSAGTSLGTLNTTNVKSTGDFSAKGLHLGQSGSFGVQVNNSARTGLKLCRGWVENLKRSGRNPVTVLDDDYTATISRAVY